MTRQEPARRVGVVLFDRFELLDVCGPLEMLGLLPDRFSFLLLGPQAGSVASNQGPRLVADASYDEAPRCEIVFVPGGVGTRTLVGKQPFLDWLSQYAAGSELVVSVCTGSGVLAAAGLLDGYRATSNKRAFEWARQQGSRVEWVQDARWVHDRDRWTSSGVAAGIDMTLALIAHLHGDDLAQGLADATEYVWQRHASPDPFAPPPDWLCQ